MHVLRHDYTTNDELQQTLSDWEKYDTMHLYNKCDEMGVVIIKHVYVNMSKKRKTQ